MELPRWLSGQNLMLETKPLKLIADAGEGRILGRPPDGSPKKPEHHPLSDL